MGAFTAMTNQYGTQVEGLDYAPRTGGYGILAINGKIACSRIGYGPYSYDFPGGAADPGETPAQAAVREFGEEVGLVVEVVRPIADLNQYFIHEDGTPYNNHSHVFEVRLIGENPALKIEADHELVWLDPLLVITHLKNEGYAWPMALWLRDQAI
jgi:8-oxo-dGTP diphosphatase